MPGAQLQLVAVGKQDLFLIGQPQMTFWKQVYRRYTNFAIEAVPIVFDGGADFGKRVTAIIPHTGDLLSQLMLEVELPAPYAGNADMNVSWVNSVGHALIEEIRIEIDDKEFDKQTGEWMEIWTSLALPSSKRDGFNAMIGRVGGAYDDTSMTGPLTLQIPLHFWFCRNPGTALPIVALQRSTIRVTLKLRSFSELRYTRLMNTQLNSTLPIPDVHMTSCTLWADMVFLGVSERRRFVANPHEYLIEQVQTVLNTAVSATAPVVNILMPLNHPTKEVIWTIRQDRMLTTNELFNYSNVRIDETEEPTDLFTSAIIRFDGYDRFRERIAAYFRLFQPYQRHTTIPIETFIYLYSMSLRPEDPQPSGSANMSRFTTKVLTLAMPAGGKASTVNVYAPNYNILRVIDGRAGLMFYV